MLSTLKKIALITLVLTVMSFSSLYIESKRDVPDNSAHQWRQPQSVSVKYPLLISQHHWPFDYELVELALQEVKLDEEGALLIDADTADVLSRAVAELPVGMNENILQRVIFLTAKGLPGPAGEQLALILKNYYRYQQTSKEISGLDTEKVGEVRSEHLFQQDIALKELYMGKEVTKGLFGHKHLVRNYLFSRRKVNENSDLSRQQKKQRLTELEDQFKRKRKLFQISPKKNT